MNQKEIKNQIEQAKRIRAWKKIQAKHKKLYDKPTEENKGS